MVALGSSGDFLIVQAPRKATAWIFAKHVKKDAGGTGLVIVNDAALRSDSRSTAEKIGTVKEGDTILFGKYSGQEIKLDGDEYLIMREDEVLAVLDSKGK